MQTTTETRSHNLDCLPVLLTVKDLQVILGVSRATAYQLVHRRDFPVLKLGRSLRVPREALRRWIEAQVEAQVAAACKK